MARSQIQNQELSGMEGSSLPTKGSFDVPYITSLMANIEEEDKTLDALLQAVTSKDMNKANALAIRLRELRSPGNPRNCKG